MAQAGALRRGSGDGGVARTARTRARGGPPTAGTGGRGARLRIVSDEPLPEPAPSMVTKEPQRHSDAPRGMAFPGSSPALPAVRDWWHGGFASPAILPP